jgi:hypothetical protein
MIQFLPSINIIREWYRKMIEISKLSSKRNATSLSYFHFSILLASPLIFLLGVSYSPEKNKARIIEFPWNWYVFYSQSWCTWGRFMCPAGIYKHKSTFQSLKFQYTTFLCRPLSPCFGEVNVQLLIINFSEFRIHFHCVNWARQGEDRSSNIVFGDTISNKIWIRTFQSLRPIILAAATYFFKCKILPKIHIFMKIVKLI